MGLVSKINYFPLGRRTRLCRLFSGSWRLWEVVTFFAVFPCFLFSLYSWGVCCFGGKVEHPQIVLKNISVATLATIFLISLAIAWWVRDHLVPLRGELTLCRCLYIYISNITYAERFKPVLTSPACLALCNPSETISFKASTIWNSLQNYLFKKLWGSKGLCKSTNENKIQIEQLQLFISFQWKLFKNKCVCIFWIKLCLLPGALFAVAGWCQLERVQSAGISVINRVLCGTVSVC